MEHTKPRIQFIINPIAGHGRGEKIISEVEHLLDKERYGEPLVTLTRERGDATRLAQEAIAQGRDIVVAVGGDGTVNEVARALVGSSTALGIVPCGSGNGLALHVGIPLIPSQAIGILNREHIQTIDSATINGHPFFCTAGVGYDAKVAYEYAHSGTRGLLTYVQQALVWWSKYEPQEYLIITEHDTIRTRALLITCANANQWGNNCHIAPSASLVDGLLEVTIVHPVTVPNGIKLAMQLPGFSIENNKNVVTLHAKNIRIERPQADVAHFDGEAYMEDAVIDLAVRPASLRILTPLDRSL